MWCQLVACFGVVAACAFVGGGEFVGGVCCEGDGFYCG